MNHNHAGYESRLDFVRVLLKEQFKIEDKDVDILPIDYDPECPFKYNNFVYRLVLATPTARADSIKKPGQPGCVAIPDGTKEFILRLTNPDADGMNKQNRVENEVATINLVSAALAQAHLEIVPSVYGWASAAGEAAQGWILQQLMPGVPLDTKFKDLDLEGKQRVFVQMATMLHSMQRFQLPEGVTGFGGLTYDKTGSIVSAPMTSVDSGPWPSYEASFNDQLIIALKQVDENPYIKGWRANGVRDRVDSFIEAGLAKQFQSLSSKEDMNVVHADFTGNNMLYDPLSGHITGLIDYDFACVMHPSHEFMHSLNNIGEQLRGWSGDEDSEQIALRDAKLRGFPSSLPKSSEDGVQWEVVKAWEDELERQQVLRPRVMEGIEKVADVDALLRAITPWRLTNSDILRLQSEESKVKHRDECEVQLVKILEHLGF